MFNASIRYFEDFLGAKALAVAASAQVGFAALNTATNGTGTVIGLTNCASGLCKLSLSSTDEAVAATLYHGDICSFKADDLQTVAFRLNTGASITTAQSLVFGMTSAFNSDPDATSYNVQFKLAASTAVVVETDDGATDNDDKATGQTLGTTMKEFMIDFRQGLGDIRFYASDAGGKLVRVAAGTTFSATALSGKYLQPSITLAKTGGTTTPSAYVDYVEILAKRS